MQTPLSVGVPQTSTTWSCLCPLSAGCGSMCEHNLTCSSAWSGAWLGSSSGQFRRQSWLGVRWVSDLKPYANLICGILIYELNCQGGSSVKLPKVFPVAQVRHVHAGALYIPEQFGASFGILCMSRSCWLRQDSLLCWMPNQAAASFFLVSFFFRFFAVLFGLAVFKFFFFLLLRWDGRRRLHSESSFIPRNLVLLVTLLFLLWLPFLLLLFSLSVYLPSAC